MSSNEACAMRFPTIFINHGGGPMPLLGRQQLLVSHMKQAAELHIPSRPKSIIVLSAHWEADPIQITNYNRPLPLYFDYYGFPPETYKYEYSPPAAPDLSMKIQKLLKEHGIDSQLEDKRGFDHGAFVPLLIMYPDADIPVVAVSMHASLDAEKNIMIGQALQPLREEGVLIVGSGYSFHNLRAFFNPTTASQKASKDFNEWLKATITKSNSAEEVKEGLVRWEQAPSARMCHPREEHLLPLFMVAAAAGFEGGKLIYETNSDTGDHTVSGYLFN
jgi:aromatic ring-opening dioxygenase catalytic subunit (LigB family)